MKLIEILKHFEEKITSGKTEMSDLTSEFKDLAPYFLYGGYIKVHQEYQIYIKTVEFYFHSEVDNGIHDFIVYHRNNRDFKKTPYFPLMSLHAHNSGFDITFESERGKYRASALIRDYEVKDANGKYYYWDTEAQMFTSSETYCSNQQSTYLYAFLNGFTLGNGNTIEWVDFPREFKNKPCGKPRKNVKQYKNEQDFQTQQNWEKCDRKWSFTREDKV